jgi:hypothetical protein
MWDDRWLSGLERVLLVLFGLAVAGELVTLVDWRPGWWEGIWLGVDVAFLLALLVYLSVGGGERMTRSRVGAASLALLALSVLGNFADTFLGMDSVGWQIVWGVVAAGFAVCFAVYLIVLFRKRHRTPYPG